jgi:hypothetical protein
MRGKPSRLGEPVRALASGRLAYGDLKTTVGGAGDGMLKQLAVICEVAQSRRKMERADTQAIHENPSLVKRGSTA